jgi:hypothetical protein
MLLGVGVAAGDYSGPSGALVIPKAFRSVRGPDVLNFNSCLRDIAVTPNGALLAVGAPGAFAKQENALILRKPPETSRAILLGQELSQSVDLGNFGRFFEVRRYCPGIERCRRSSD